MPPEALRSSAALTVLVLLLAGCAGAGPGPQPLEDPETALDALFDRNTGAIQGRVLDEEAFSLAGVEILVLPKGNTTRTANDGSFSFSFLEPARYTLFFQRLGYDSISTAVQVQAGQVSPVSVTLHAIQIKEPRREVVGPFNGFMECRMSTPLSSGACGFIPVVGNTPVTSLWTNDRVLFDFEISAEDWEQIVFEARWQPSSAATNPNMMLVFSYSQRTSTHWWADSGGQESPIKMVYTRGERGPGGQLPGGSPQEPDWENHVMRTWITLPFAPLTRPVEVAYNLRFELVVTIFYSDRAPETYTALPDV